MDFRYYRDIPTTTYVWFKLLDKTGKVLEDYPDVPCYGPIAHGFDKRAQQIQIYHEKSKVPYSVECIKRWIADINEMGFPCSFIENEQPDPAALQEEFTKATVDDGLVDMAIALMRHGNEPSSPNSFHNFFVDLTKYKDKNHLFSTLSLIRCLTESGVSYVPEVYFLIMDDSPEMDKIEACQLAHKKVSNRTKRYDPTNHANASHMVTFDGNGSNITKQALMAKFEKAMVDIRDGGYLGINSSWNGSR